MEAAVAVEVPAVEVRERLVAFVEEVAARLPLRRQRENALLYVRGLVEQGGRKSLQPTLFRLEETAARYESMQQFLADSPWEPELLVRACAERVAPQIGVVGLGGRRHRDRQGRQALAGGEAAVLGHARQDRQLPDHASACTRSASGGRCRWAGGCICPRSGATIWCGGARRRSRRRSCFQTKPQLAGELCERAARLASCRRRRSSPTAPTATTPASAAGWHELELEYVLAVRRRDSVYGPETSFAVPERNGSGRAGRARSPGPTASPSRCARSPSGCRRAPGRRCPAARPRRARTSTSRFAFVRVVATNPVRNRHLPPREEWLIIEWPDRRRGAERLLALQPARRQPSRERLARLARLRWTIELDYRQLKGELGLDHYEGRSYLGFHHHARSSPARTPSSPRNGCAQKPRGRPDTAAGGAAPAARPALLGRPLPHLPPTRRPRPTHALPPT